MRISDWSSDVCSSDLFWSGGPAATVRQVADYLRALADRGGLRIDDPATAAQSFIGMVVGDLFMRGLILPGPPVPDAEIERRVRSAVRLFLDGIRRPRDAVLPVGAPADTATVAVTGRR